jgi:hypothetical protein
MNARDITSGCDNAAPTSTDNHRFVDQIGVVALFNAGIKSIAIDMGEKKPG